jgi:hypothetical protein
MTNLIDSNMKLFFGNLNQHNWINLYVLKQDWNWASIQDENAFPD